MALSDEAARRIAARIALLERVRDRVVIDGDTHPSDPAGFSPDLQAKLAAEPNYFHGRPITGEELLAELRLPVLAVPGNHDTRHGIRRLFPDALWADGEHASCVVDLDDPEVGPIRFVGLDSTRPGEPGAEFDDARERWLVDAIGSAPGRVALALHHPPFTTGIQWMDDSGFVGLDRLEAVLDAHPVERIVSGHIHRALCATVSGIPATTGPSTVHHVDLDLAPDAPVSVIVDPPAYALHHITPNGWVTHQRFYATGAERIHPGWA